MEVWRTWSWFAVRWRTEPESERRGKKSKERDIDGFETSFLFLVAMASNLIAMAST